MKVDANKNKSHVGRDWEKKECRRLKCFGRSSSLRAVARENVFDVLKISTRHSPESSSVLCPLIFRFPREDGSAQNRL